MYGRVFAGLSLSFLCVFANAQGDTRSRSGSIATPDSRTDEPKAQLVQSVWRARIQSLLDAGKLPKIDMETSWSEDTVRSFVPGIFPLMDELGIALIAADGYQRKQDGSTGYRWGTYIREI